MLKYGFVLLVATAFFSGLNAAHAQKGPSTTGEDAQNGPKFAIASTPQRLPNRRLRSTLVSFHQPSSGIALTGGVTAPLDTATSISCPADTTAHCIVEADITIQIGFAATASTNTDICFKVDGATVACPTFNNIQTVGWTFVSFSHIAWPVGTGAHTVQTTTRTGANAFRGMYTIKYNVYKPT